MDRKISSNEFDTLSPNSSSTEEMPRRRVIDRIIYRNTNYITNISTSSGSLSVFSNFSTQVYSIRATAEDAARYEYLCINQVLREEKLKMHIIPKRVSLDRIGFNEDYYDKSFCFKQPGFKKHLKESILIMIAKKKYPDFKIHIQGNVIECNLHVLQYYSEFFQDWVEKYPDRSISMSQKEVTHELLVTIYDWMLTKKNAFKIEGLVGLFKAAQFLRIKEMCEQCWLLFDKEKLFFNKNAFTAFLEARSLNMELIKLFMVQRICKYFIHIIAREEFLEFNVDDVCLLLETNTIGIASELEVFYAAVLWINHKYDERKEDGKRVIQCVRFGLWPNWALISLPKMSFEQEVVRVFEYDEVRDCMFVALGYKSMNLYYDSEYNAKFRNDVRSVGVEIPVQRTWIFNPSFPYHHNIICNKLRMLTYSLFLEYLEFVRATPELWKESEIYESPSDFICCRQVLHMKSNRQPLRIQNF